ncbi:FAD-dependent oxidoreductase [Exiguobacterium antarcticum]|uniref:FAD-dependent oxidoreductase n=1 Tax=Exiguobacterium antarcticum TaxID=132920 RepID=A0ABT6R5K7_9BACL|nr:FAD-dependent oxidoreductase [Exiguobacterium antarcticum]MDI3236221.1 FAD-dependent oxidoreductase [Exiguobacterium antarcticum]
MKRIVLVGAGHAHLECIKQGSHPDVDWIVINPSRYQYYSGMFSGLADGTYTLDETRIDVKALCEHNGKTWIEDRVTRIDAANKQVICQSGQVLSYDIVSCNIGSRDWDVAGAPARVTIKPNYQIDQALETFRKAASPVIIGSGAAAVEMAASFQSNGTPVTLIHEEPLLSGHPAGIKIAKRLDQLGVKRIVDRFDTLDDQTARLRSGQSIETDAMLFLGGARASELFQASDLYCDTRGFLLVHETLQALEDPSIFAVGDCATLTAYPNTPKNGVTAVRQAPVLLENLLRFVNQERLLAFRPQQRYLTILALGDQQATLLYGRFYQTSRLSWYLKQWIDRKFIKKYTN